MEAIALHFCLLANRVVVSSDRHRGRERELKFCKVSSSLLKGARGDARVVRTGRVPVLARFAGDARGSSDVDGLLAGGTFWDLGLEGVGSADFVFGFVVGVDRRALLAAVAAVAGFGFAVEARRGVSMLRAGDLLDGAVQRMDRALSQGLRGRGGRSAEGALVVVDVPRRVCRTGAFSRQERTSVDRVGRIQDLSSKIWAVSGVVHHQHGRARDSDVGV